MVAVSAKNDDPTTFNGDDAEVPVKKLDDLPHQDSPTGMSYLQ